MRALALALTLLGAFPALSAAAEPTYPPVDAYLMPRDAEIKMARSAAPPSVAGHATVKVLTRTGFVVAEAGTNGAVCLVMRGFSAPTYTPAELRAIVYDPTIRAPICFTAPSARSVLPYYELRTILGLAGKTPDQIATAVQAAYDSGKLPRRDGVTFAYMFSAHQHLGPGINAWHPHMMVFAPNYQNAMLGGNPFGGVLPAVTDDAGTPFAVVVIVAGDDQAIHMPAH
jgi:hypothetical protein